MMLIVRASSSMISWSMRVESMSKTASFRGAEGGGTGQGWLEGRSRSVNSVDVVASRCLISGEWRS